MRIGHRDKTHVAFASFLWFNCHMKILQRTVTNPSFNPLFLMGLDNFQDIPSKGHAILKKGMSSNLLEPVSRYLGLGKVVLSGLIDIDRSTLNRIVAREQQLPLHAAETVLRLLEVHDMAIDVFCHEQDAEKWMRAAHVLLNGETPFEACKTSFGSNQVKNLLMSMKYGGVA